MSVDKPSERVENGLLQFEHFSRPKKFTLKAFKRYWFTCRDLHLRMYKTSEDAAVGSLPVHSVSLKGCEVTPDVNISQNKFGIKLEVPSSDGMTEMCIRCESVSVKCCQTNTIYHD